MKKALDQTVRDLKREVNKKVLKVPSIEQKTLDATSNEQWVPRGALIAEIAQASCNYNDYQLIMAVLWRRIQDTGKNWRHVYKALSVLEYLAIYGTERAIDDIREHAYQISTLSDFLYTDSNGRDQGSNVRRKSQTLVALVNNKERLQEARNKAQSNKEKVSRPPLSSSARYNDEHFDGGNKADVLERGRYLVVRNKDRRRGGGDKYGQDSDEFCGRDDDHRVCANGDYQCMPRSQSADEYANNSFDDYDHRSTRSDGGRVDESLHDERIDAPPSYEAATNDSWSDVQNDSLFSDATMASMQKASSPSGPKAASSRDTNLTTGSVAVESDQAHENEAVSFAEFDPRGSVSGAPTVVSSGLELNIFGLSAVDYTDSLASILGLSDTFALSSTAHAVPSEQPDGNPFGDSPFKAIPQENFQSETDTSASPPPQPPPVPLSSGGINLQSEKKMEAAQSSDLYPDAVSNGQNPLGNPNLYPSQFPAPNSSNDILQGILPRTDPVASDTQPSQNSPETGSENPPMGRVNPFEQPEPSDRRSGRPNPFDFHPFQPDQMNSAENSILPLSSQLISMEKQDSQSASSVQSKPPLKQQNLSSQAIPPSWGINSLGINGNQPWLSAPQASPFSSGRLNPLQHPIASTAQPPLTASSSFQGSGKPEPSNKKFEPKSAIWADTISRGLINLNISGPRTNPLADIGIDFDDINRKEKRNEAKSSQTPSSSSSAMGRAMGPGSGLGRAAGGAPAAAAIGIGGSAGMMGPSVGMPRRGHGFPAAYNAMNPTGGGYGHHQPFGRGGYS